MEEVKSEVDRASPDGANQTDEDKNAESTRSQNVDSAEVEAANPKPINLFTDQLIEDMIKCNVGAAKGDKPVEEPSTSKGDHEKKDAKFKNANGAKGNTPRRQRERNVVNTQQKEPQTEGNLPKNCLRQCGKLYNADRSQYVKRRPEVDCGQGNLLYSAKFKEGGVMWKLHGEAGLLTSSNEYVAQVTVRQLEELDLATTFNFAKGVLRKNLKVTKVLLDEHHIDVEKVKQSCDEYLKGVFANTIDNVQNAEDLYQLESILKLKSSALDKCLDHELNLLLKLLNHFEVGRPTSSERFPYKFKIFENIESNPEYKQVIEHANKAFGHQRNKKSTVLPDELHVWICLLDDTIAQFFSNDEHIVKLSSALLKLYMNYSLSGQMSLDSLESLRVITHNTICFVAQAGPFVHPKNEQDNYIIMKQIGYMNRASLEGRMSFTDYRDLIEVFAQYWKQRSDAIDGLEAKLPGDCFKHEVEAVQSLLMQCLAGALDKNVKLVDLISFCRVYEELLVDVHNLPLDWFVRMPTTDFADIFLRKGVISVVENKWKDSDQQCYRVKDFEKFERVYRVLFEDVELPRNYLVETIKALLKCINSMEEKKHWKDGLVLTESDQLIATGLLITSVRKSLLYLKEQADYISFDRFLEENTKPFVTVSNDSSCFEDFKKRITLIKESYWYIRNLNVIDIDTALKLFRESNESDFNEEYLRLFYRKYSEQFEKYMTQNDSLQTTARIAPIVAEVKRHKRHYLADKWNVDFKFNVMPVLLAGLSAVWSLHVSKDVASSGQYLKPHCIQILCVSRLLSAEKVTPGVRKHLAQVLTGQGKSLVLAVVAAVLALCGHSVQVMCYSEYLATRDEKDFKEFYDYFGIRWNITYQTFEQASGEYFNTVAGNAKNISYAKIPENFPLILGVSGTLTTLSNYEKKVVKDHYNITDLSVMPSFFGGSNLKFNETQDFSCLNTVNEWMNAIFGRINMMVYARRSVLVVFDTDLKINAFKQQFAAQLDRLNVLTVDTDPADKERFINDAGVSRTITLATREMGRGVDYKSSVAVESNGGVHVIQTFFSVDVKEETQIKGRTARKDNRGSYELIVCIDHLQSEDLVDKAPGSTVATSLEEGESFDKRCGILSIHKSRFRMNPIKLQTVRPFVFETVNLICKLDEGEVQQKVQNFATEMVEEMIEWAKGKLTGNQKQPKLPLIRPRIEVTEVEQQFNAIPFRQGYSGRIANPQDMVLSAKSMTELTRRMVDYEDDDAAEFIIMFYERQAMAHLNAVADAINEDNIDEVLTEFYKKEKDTYNDMLKMLDSRIQKRRRRVLLENKIPQQLHVKLQGGATNADDDPRRSGKSRRGSRGGRRASTSKIDSFSVSAASPAKTSFPASGRNIAKMVYISDEDDDYTPSLSG
ncbi:conserved hypothetical protein [Culex quinquefasciatus]|uniref:Mre11 DNA-binding domain-containing protein n=1 Tax=Culex quinquefasciatus TaxID=7176 RepID=B0XLA0_CULQU|nr:conserved hypothetical protein [Culex quinquefasciatus]|eukprot:XP_001870422.1 conserved hypothetical protein [Culex quinquefasciatus]